MSRALSLVTLPRFMQWFIPGAIWNMPAEQKAVYLTFDDGPTPGVTDFVLEQLKQYEAKATFFCIGKNIMANKGLYKRLLEEGHTVGNHTMHHANGWRTDNEAYYNEIVQCREQMLQQAGDNKKLFRPPYGKIKPSQYRQLQKEYTLVMWDILSCDYDESLGAEKVITNVTDNAKAGSVIVFHDSVKAFARLQLALPKVLACLSQNGFSFVAL
jgi:peptidoglycan/xylan/chitin deacetylase (PgdA/CDA1 family)